MSSSGADEAGARDLLASIPGDSDTLLLQGGSALIAPDISFVTNAIFVSDVRKGGCDLPADRGGYWCDYRVTVRGVPMFAAMLSDLPSRARFVRSGTTWQLVDVPPRQRAPVMTGSDPFAPNPAVQEIIRLSEMGMQMDP